MDAILNFLKHGYTQKAIVTIFLAAACLLTIKIILVCLDKFLERSKLERLPRKILRISLKAFLLFVSAIILLSYLGIEVSSLVATLSIIGVALSLAVQGFLSNVFGGIQIIANKPFKIGDYVEIGSDAGLIREVGLFYTKLDTYDKKLIQIPNGKLTNETIINYTDSNKRRMEFVVCVSYDNTTEHVISTLVKTMSAHPLVLQDEGFKPFAHVKEYQYSHICYTARAWCETQNYWTVYFDIMDTIQPAFAENGVKFSYPHMNVHMMDK